MTRPFFKTVVLGIDFSPFSRVVAHQARKLARQAGAQLIYTYAVDRGHFLDEPERYGITHELPLDEKEITKSLRRYYHLKPSADHAIEVHRGEPEDVLIETAQRNENSLIMVGCRGSGNVLARVFLGSHAQALALRSPVPVWIHRGDKAITVRKILAPVDLSTGPRKIEFGKNAPMVEHLFVWPELAPMYLSPFYLEAFDRACLAIEERFERFQTSYPELKINVQHGDPAGRILKAARGFDLIVMTPHAQAAAVKSFGGKTAEVLRSSPIPVLILPARGTDAASPKLSPQRPFEGAGATSAEISAIR